MPSTTSLIAVVIVDDVVPRLLAVTAPSSSVISLIAGTNVAAVVPIVAAFISDPIRESIALIAFTTVETSNRKVSPLLIVETTPVSTTTLTPALTVVTLVPAAILPVRPVSIFRTVISTTIPVVSAIGIVVSVAATALSVSFWTRVLIAPRLAAVATGLPINP